MRRFMFAFGIETCYPLIALPEGAACVWKSGGDESLPPPALSIQGGVAEDFHALRPGFTLIARFFV